MSTPEQFHSLVREATDQIGPAPLDAQLQARLNRDLGPQSEWYARLFEACLGGIAGGRRRRMTPAMTSFARARPP
ncbi:hypothetical protein CEK29_02400 [Bordetella genomosp. 5]|uniref:DUF4863 family protein n=1 Tax=Bordetella genomosp. 5 TaxID=1395608 RepID=UPI000B9E6DC6|nr:DUF4863 family protein [Bordetella genomosp. 5]OZI47612.1 hypothetical protein CEK29_02400 [Bordetella genomosp. 5]